MESQEAEEEGEAVPEKGLANIELDENAILWEDGMESEKIGTPAEKEKSKVVNEAPDHTLRFGQFCYEPNPSCSVSCFVRNKRIRAN